MPIATETKDSPELVTSRTPVGPKNASTVTAGVAAVRDSVVIILAAWAILFALMWSLRSHNV
jgi:hypothetical protein